MCAEPVSPTLRSEPFFHCDIGSRRGQSHWVGAVRENTESGRNSAIANLTVLESPAGKLENVDSMYFSILLQIELPSKFAAAEDVSLQIVCSRLPVAPKC
jgi:hypothetical protein